MDERVRLEAVFREAASRHSGRKYDPDAFKVPEVRRAWEEYSEWPDVDFHQAKVGEMIAKGMAVPPAVVKEFLSRLPAGKKAKWAETVKTMGYDA